MEIEIKRLAIKGKRKAQKRKEQKMEVHVCHRVLKRENCHMEGKNKHGGPRGF